MENVYLYTITELTFLIVNIKQMRPVTEIPVADLTFLFRGDGYGKLKILASVGSMGGSINMMEPFLHL